MSPTVGSIWARAIRSADLPGVFTSVKYRGALVDARGTWMGLRGRYFARLSRRPLPLPRRGLLHRDDAVARPGAIGAARTGLDAGGGDQLGDGAVEVEAETLEVCHRVVVADQAEVDLPFV